MMLTVVYIAPNRPIAEMLKELLEGGGILAMLRPLGPPHLGDSASVEILVSESEVEEANDIIAASFG
jgi:hypothetical protein